MHLNFQVVGECYFDTFCHFNYVKLACGNYIIFSLPLTSVEVPHVSPAAEHVDHVLMSGNAET